MTAGPDFLLHRLRATFTSGPPLVRLGVAVSGGGDSVALLHLLCHWAQNGGPLVHAVTVDHGLRDAAVVEAAEVASLCAGLGVSHEILTWRGWDGRGNLPDQARRARYGLIADWARGREITCVALGHTADDQAETFLMRLARGSGVDGLSGMAVWRRQQGLDWVRPLLGSRRAELRDWLIGHKITWSEDPTNADPAYERVKARQALPLLAPLGISPGVLVETAQRLSMARDALAWFTQKAAYDCCHVDLGDVVFDQVSYRQLPLETQLRLLAAAIRWVSSADYRPRLDSLTRIHADLTGIKRRTLGGCLVSSTAIMLRVAREVAAVQDVVSPATALWDNRWRLNGPDTDCSTIRALGEAGLAQCPDWRATGHPRSSLLASPAVWVADRLISAPLAGKAAKWSAELHRGATDFFSALIVH